VASLYLNESLHPDAFEVGRRLPVVGADARHATQVARIRTGERVAVGDGRGRLAWGPVSHIGQGEFAITAEDLVIEVPRLPRLVLVQALAKGDRDELAIQAATELGVDAVVPWQAARSVSKWDGPKIAKGLERWRAVVREASKQAIRPTVPEVLDLLDTKSLLRSLGDEGALRLAALPQEPRPSESKGLTLVLEPTAQHSLASQLPVTGIDTITLIVGPEGGISIEELLLLDAAGAVPVRLGTEVLRTSTAGPAALAAIAVILDRW
jgi:16S rRNA (uracil1498-N3)-methyltransferase